MGLCVFFALNFSPYFGVMSSNGSSLVLISVRLFPSCLSRYVFFYTFSDCILFCDNYRYNQDTFNTFSWKNIARMLSTHVTEIQIFFCFQKKFQFVIFVPGEEQNFSSTHTYETEQFVLKTKNTQNIYFFFHLGCASKSENYSSKNVSVKIWLNFCV